MFYLIIAILFEVVGTTCMKFLTNSTYVVLSIFVFVSYGLCCAFFTLALRTVEIGTAYAIVAGSGIFIIALIGFICFQETATPLKIVATALIIVGVITLHLAKT